MKQRLDIWIMKNFESLPDTSKLSSKEKEGLLSQTRGFWQKEIEKGNILVNSKKAKPGQKVSADSDIHLKWKRLKRDWYNCCVPKPLPYPIRLDVIKKTNKMLAVNKPAGISVYTSFPLNLNRRRKAGLLDGIVCHFPEVKKAGRQPERAGIVHRLDKKTSGIMLIARNRKKLLSLKSRFKKGAIQKTYLALVKGDFPHKYFQISGDMGKSRANPLVRMIENLKLTPLKEMDLKNPVKPAASQRVSSRIINPKHSLTLGEKIGSGSFKELKKTAEGMIVKQWERIYGEDGNFSLLKLHPVTGRTHQLRVQLKEAGYSIVGDSLYGQDKNLPCHFLHAYRIKFKQNGKDVLLTSKRISIFQTFTY